MPGIAELALGAAPLAGGALLGIAAGNLRGPDFRGMITKDMDLLERIPIASHDVVDFGSRRGLRGAINESC